jgi:hypothetical protein
MSKTDFYVAVATAIPVLLIAYAVGMTGYASGVLGPSYQRDTEATVAAFLDLASTRTGKFNNALAAFVRTVRWTKNMLFLFLYVLAVVLPLAGEAAALYALTSGSSLLTELLSWAGIAFGLVAVGIPLLAVGLKALPFWSSITEWNAMKQMLGDIRTIYAGWEDDTSKDDWAAESIRVWRVHDSGNEQEWQGKANLTSLASNVWNGTYPRWIQGLIVDRQSLLVFDRINDAQGTNHSDGASFFKFENHRVSELRVYESRSDAEAAHPRLHRAAAPVPAALPA